LNNLTDSTASFTSWTRKILAPFVNPIVFRTVVPFKASFELIFKDLVIIDFLEKPTRATQAFQTILVFAALHNFGLEFWQTQTQSIIKSFMQTSGFMDSL
jgi:hypothetical protein